MHFSKRILSAIIASLFLFNTVSSDLVYALAPAAALDDTVTLSRMALEMELKALDGLVDIDGATDAETIRRAFKKCEAIRSSGTKSGPSGTEPAKIRAGFPGIQQVGENTHIFRIPVIIRKAGKRYDHQLVFSTIRNKDGHFPATLYIQEEFDKQAAMIAERDTFVVRSEPEPRMETNSDGGEGLMHQSKLAILPKQSGKPSELTSRHASALRPLRDDEMPKMPAVSAHVHDLLEQSVRGGPAAAISAIMTDKPTVKALIKTGIWGTENDLRETLNTCLFSGDSRERTTELRRFTSAVGEQGNLGAALGLISRVLDLRNLKEEDFRTINEFMHRFFPDVGENLEGLFRDNTDIQFKSFEWLMLRVRRAAGLMITDEKNSALHGLLARSILREFNRILSDVNNTKHNALRLLMIIRFANVIAEEETAETTPIRALFKLLYPEVSRDIFLAVDSHFSLLSRLYETDEKSARAVLEPVGGFEAFCTATSTLLAFACDSWPDAFFSYLRDHYQNASPFVRAYYLAAMSYGIKKAGDTNKADPDRLAFVIRSTVELCANPSPQIQAKCAQIIRIMPDVFIAYLDHEDLYASLTVIQRGFLIEQLLSLGPVVQKDPERARITKFAMHELSLEANEPIQEKVLFSEAFSREIVPLLSAQQGITLQDRIINSYSRFKGNDITAKRCIDILLGYDADALWRCYEYFRQHLDREPVKALSVLVLAGSVSARYEATDAKNRLKFQAMIGKIQELVASAVDDKLASAGALFKTNDIIAQLECDIAALDEHARQASDVVNKVNIKVEQLRVKRDNLLGERTYMAEIAEGQEISMEATELMTGRHGGWRSVVRSLKERVFRIKPAKTEEVKPDTIDQELAEIDALIPNVELPAVGHSNGLVGKVFDAYILLRARLAQRLSLSHGVNTLKVLNSRLLAVSRTLAQAEKEQSEYANRFAGYSTDLATKRKQLNMLIEKVRPDVLVKANTAFARASELFGAFRMFLASPSIVGDAADSVRTKFGVYKDAKEDAVALLILADLANNHKIADKKALFALLGRIVTHIRDHARHEIYRYEIMAALDAATGYLARGLVVPVDEKDPVLFGISALLKSHLYDKGQLGEMQRIESGLEGARKNCNKACYKSIDDIIKVCGQTGNSIFTNIRDFLRRRFKGEDDTPTIRHLIWFFGHVFYAKGDIGDDPHAALTALFFELSGLSGKYYLAPIEKDIAKPLSINDRIEQAYRTFFTAKHQLAKTELELKHEALLYGDGEPWPRETTGRCLEYIVGVFVKNDPGLPARKYAEAVLYNTVFNRWMRETDPFSATILGDEPKVAIPTADMLSALESYYSRAPIIKEGEVYDGSAGHDLGHAARLAYAFSKKVIGLANEINPTFRPKVAQILKRFAEMIDPNVELEITKGDWVKVRIAVDEAIKALEASGTPSAARGYSAGRLDSGSTRPLIRLKAPIIEIDAIGADMRAIGGADGGQTKTLPSSATTVEPELRRQEAQSDGGESATPAETLAKQHAPWLLNTLLEKIVNMPDFKGKITAGELQKYVVKTNSNGYFYMKERAPIAVKLKGSIGKLFGLEDEDLPLYITIAIEGNFDPAEFTLAKKDRKDLDSAKEGTDLARDMVPKSLLAEVLFDGAKTVLYAKKDGYIAVTAVYGDQGLLDKGLVVAKGGLRIYFKPGTVKQDVFNAVDRFCPAFIDLGTLGFSCMLGPDLTPAFMNVDENMDHLDEIGVRAAKELGIELLPMTTSGSPEKGFLSHDEWRGTSLTVLENLCALLEHKPTMERFDIDASGKIPVTINIQGFGEVGSNIVRLLKELGARYKKYNFVVTGVSDEAWAYYSKEGFPIEKLYEFADAFKKWRKDHQEDKLPFDFTPDKWSFLTKHSLSKVDDLLYQPATVLMPAGPGYVFPNEEQLSKLNVKLVMPAANIWLGNKDSTPADVRRLELFLLNKGILSYPSWMANFGGIGMSEEEILHRYFEGSLAALARPKLREWLKRHVLGGDLIDISWVNGFWASYLWQKDGYKHPIAEIMRGRAKEVYKEKVRLLRAMKAPANNREKLELMDVAIRMAKSYVLAEDLKDALPELMGALAEKDTAVRAKRERERRVAAYLMGAIGGHGHIKDLVSIIEDDTESGLMYRGALVSLCYILIDERNKSADADTIIGPIIARLSALLKKIDAGPEIFEPISKESGIERRAWLEWLLRRVDGRELDASAKPMEPAVEKPLTADAVAALPKEWHNNAFDIDYFFAEFRGIVDDLMHIDDNAALIFSEKVTFENGFGILLPKLAQHSRARICVIASNDREKRLVQELNDMLPKEKRLICAENIDGIKKLHPVARYYYYKVIGDPEAGSGGVTTFDITAVVKRILEAIGTAVNISRDLDSMEAVYRSMQKFIEAAA